VLSKKIKDFLKYLSDIFTIAVLYIGFIAFFLVCYTNYTWGNVYVEQMIIAALNDFDTIGSYIITKYVLFAFVPACIMTLICRWFIKKNLWLNIASLCMIGYAVWSIKLVEYLLNQNVYTELYETEYANPADLTFKFPDKKRNLILFYLESMEADYADSNLTGENLLPNLSRYQKNELHFPNFFQMPMQDYTIAAMVSSMCGVPYRTPKGINPYKIKNFLPHLKCFPQILKENGYENYTLRSSDLDFAGARKFFKLHGFKHMKDKADMEKDIDLANHGGTSWGYNDRTYYEAVKKELAEIAEKKTPFMFVMITLDTHAPDVYLDKQCEKTFDDKRDVIKCADSMASEFLDWLQKQDFYKDTTVVVIGDHPETGNNNIYPAHKNRKIVNFILNPAKNSIPQEHKIWSTIDLAPTILNAMGVEFGGAKFGLGRSLLKNEPTLYEVYQNRLSNEVLKSSHLYDRFYHKKAPNGNK
jgi:phosphoglycerol transferase